MGRWSSGWVVVWVWAVMWLGGVDEWGGRVGWAGLVQHHLPLSGALLPGPRAGLTLWRSACLHGFLLFHTFDSFGAMAP